MILFFTSDHCAWCDIVKGMLDNASLELGEPTLVYEVNIDRHPSIAEAYGIMTVPTLVSKGNMICGVPSSADLTSFLMQSVTESTKKLRSGSPSTIIRSTGRLVDLPEASTQKAEQRATEQIERART